MEYKGRVVWAILGLILLYGGHRSLAFDPAQVRAAPVEFYGVVIDQLGTPVAHALVAYSIYHSPAGQTLRGPGAGVTKMMTKTHADGTFSVRGNGGYMYINQVYKPGYLFQPVLNAFVYESSKYCYDGSPYCGAHNIHKPDRKQPVVIDAWKITETMATLESGEERYTYKMNGQPYRVPMDGVEQGLFAAFTRLPSVSDDFRERPWRVTFTLPHGGIIETDDYFMFEAPAEGYVPELEFESLGEHWIERKFYLRTDDGKVHARVKLRFTGFYGNGEDRKGYISYSYVLNSANSPLLLPDVGPYFKQWPR